MHLLSVVFFYEWCSLMRNRVVLPILGLFMALSFYAIHYGAQEIKREQAVIGVIQQQTTKEQQAYAAGIFSDTSTAKGKAAWEKAAYPSMVRSNLQYAAVDAPAPLAALSIGQRDVNRYYVRLNAQNLYQELFKSDITNPSKLLAGNFDLAFVYTYLLPLLIIAISYNVLSGEKEMGTYALLAISYTGIRRVTLCRILFYYMIVAAIVLMVSLSALVLQGIAGLWGVTWFTLATFVYVAFWCSLVFFVNALNKSSSFNAILLSGAWILLLIVFPGWLNKVIANRYPVDSSLLSNVIRRKTMESSDTAFAHALTVFYREYPAYNTAGTARTEFFSFKGYSAFLVMQEKASGEQVEEYYRQTGKRYALLERFNVINPALNLQTTYNAIAGTDLDHVLMFRRAVKDFYSQIWRFCNGPLFKDRLLTAHDYRQLPVFRQPPEKSPLPVVISGMVILTLTTAIFMGAGSYFLSSVNAQRRRYVS